MRSFIYAKILSSDEKSPALTSYYDFGSFEFKFKCLKAACRDGYVFGAPINELLTVFGDKHIMWIDVDTRDHSLVEQWENSKSFPFPKESYIKVVSTTGRLHFYVNTDRALKVDECYSMRDHIRQTIETELRAFVDKVCGPFNVESVFIPGAARGKPELPQIMMRDVKDVYKLPTLEGSIFSEWKKRKLNVSSG